MLAALHLFCWTKTDAELSDEFFVVLPQVDAAGKAAAGTQLH